MSHRQTSGNFVNSWYIKASFEFDSKTEVFTDVERRPKGADHRSLWNSIQEGYRKCERNGIALNENVRIQDIGVWLSGLEACIKFNVKNSAKVM